MGGGGRYARPTGDAISAVRSAVADNWRSRFEICERAQANGFEHVRPPVMYRALAAMASGESPELDEQPSESGRGFDYRKVQR